MICDWVMRSRSGDGAPAVAGGCSAKEKRNPFRFMGERNVVPQWKRLGNRFSFGGGRQDFSIICDCVS